jgi:hypothetical protein
MAMAKLGGTVKTETLNTQAWDTTGSWRGSSTMPA